MRIRIVAVGHLKEKHWKAAETAYRTRLAPYVNVSIEEVDDLPIPKNASPAEETEVRDKEGAKLLARLKEKELAVALDLGHEEMDSLTLASRLMGWMREGRGEVTFLIGGSLGLSEEVKKRADAFLTLSRLTFTHEMSRIILLEQLYRSFRIERGEPYHK